MTLKLTVEEICRNCGKRAATRRGDVIKQYHNCGNPPPGPRPPPRTYDADTVTLITREMSGCLDAMTDFYTPIEAGVWFYSAQSLLNGASPFEMFSAGKGTEVWAVVDQLKSGAYI